MPKNHDALDCVADLDRMLDYCEARLAQTESMWLAHVARTRTMDGRYSGSAVRPKGPGGAMNTRTTHFTKKAAQRAISWGDKRRPD